jgi:hypothetical protein
MANREVRIDPPKYEFFPNSYYSDPWIFLPDVEQIKIIGQQLTYLNFHEWLMTNLQSRDPISEPDKWRGIAFHVAEGFYKTDLLLYASICEAALYSVLKKYFDSMGARAPEDLRVCFERTEPKIKKLGYTVNDNKTKGQVDGELAIYREVQKSLKNTELKFQSLIAAGKTLSIYQDRLATRLDKLREHRNAIHLAQHIKVRDTSGNFTALHRKAAKSVTEALRVSLEAHIRINPL